MNTLCYYSSSDNTGLTVIGILVGCFFVFIIGINIYGALKNWIEREEEKAKEARRNYKFQPPAPKDPWVWDVLGTGNNIKDKIVWMWENPGLAILIIGIIILVIGSIFT